ncbi:hypothetical protein BOX15_Mlig022630g2, partial [Macrostomum lignano]
NFSRTEMHEEATAAPPSSPQWLLFLPESMLATSLKLPLNKTSSTTLTGRRNEAQRVATVLEFADDIDNVEPLDALLISESTLIVFYDPRSVRDSLFMTHPSDSLGALPPTGPRLDAFRQQLGCPSSLARPAGPAAGVANQKPASLLATALSWCATISRIRSAWQNFKLSLPPNSNPHAAAQLALQLLLGACLVLAANCFCDAVSGLNPVCCRGGDSGGCAFALRHWTAQLELALRSALEWLRRYPAGLKLHSGAARVLAQGLAYQLSIWHQWTDSLLLPIVTANLWRASLLLAAVGGAPCQLALLSDFCRLVALHLRLLDSLCCRLCCLQLRLLGAAARLLRGRKWNPLRLRADSAPYQLDQLLLCTLAFAVLLFMLPTFAAFAGVLLAFHLVWRACDWGLLALAAAPCRLPALLTAVWLANHRLVYAVPRFELATSHTASYYLSAVGDGEVRKQPALRLKLDKIGLGQALRLGPAFYRV